MPAARMINPPNVKTQDSHSGEVRMEPTNFLSGGASGQAIYPANGWKWLGGSHRRLYEQKQRIDFSTGGGRPAQFAEALGPDRQTCDARNSSFEGIACTTVRRVEPLVDHNLENSSVGG